MNAVDAIEQMARDISVRAPTAVHKVPTYGSYLGALLAQISKVSSLTRYEVGILVPAEIDLSGVSVYQEDPPVRLGLTAMFAIEFDARGQVTRRRGLLSYSDDDREALVEILQAADDAT